MSTAKIVLGFVPWIAFSLICGSAGPDGVAVAALVSLVLAAAFVGRSLVRRESVKLVEASAVVTFAVIGAWALIDPTSDGFLDFYGRGVVTLVLAAVIAASLAWRPFTEQYARESVAQEYWDSPRFHAVNRRITVMWALAVTVMGIGHLTSGALTGYPASLVVPADVLLNWVIPFGLIWLTVRYTLRTAHAAHHTSPAQVTR